LCDEAYTAFFNLSHTFFLHCPIPLVRTPICFGPRHAELTKELGEEEYVTRALEFIQKQGWSEKDATDPSGVFMRVQSVAKGEDNISNSLKNVIVEVKRKIPVTVENVKLQIPVLGDGGKMEIQMNNDGSVINASKIWRRITNFESPRRARTKPFDAAYKEALERLKNPTGYKLDRWTFGYKEAAGNVDQKELSVVYQFDFIPAVPELQLENPPHAVEISGTYQ
jgi:hypothetical protein